MEISSSAERPVRTSTSQVSLSSASPSAETFSGTRIRGRFSEEAGVGWGPDVSSVLAEGAIEPMIVWGRGSCGFRDKESMDKEQKVGPREKGGRSSRCGSNREKVRSGRDPGGRRVICYFLLAHVDALTVGHLIRYLDTTKSDDTTDRIGGRSDMAAATRNDRLQTEKRQAGRVKCHDSRHLRHRSPKRMAEMLLSQDLPSQKGLLQAKGEARWMNWQRGERRQPMRGREQEQHEGRMPLMVHNQHLPRPVPTPH